MNSAEPFRGDLAPTIAQAMCIMHELAGFRGLDSEREYIQDLIIAGIEARAGRVATLEELRRAGMIHGAFLKDDASARVGIDGELDRIVGETKRMKREERKARGTMTPMDWLCEMSESPKTDPE